MPDAATIAADPAWLPHSVDTANARLQFLKVTREMVDGPQFLAEYQPATAAGEAWLPADALAGQSLAQAPVHFVFHTAFCRSTLLVRAFNQPGIATGLSEPGILNALALEGQGAAALLEPALALLERPWRAGEAVVIKPSNIANALIPALMAARPDARAVLMSHSLAAFCGSVHRKGLMGRRWARRLYAHVQRYASLDLGLDEAGLFELTDMQVAGLAWFLQRRWFAIQQAGPAGARMLVIDGDDLAARPSEVLAQVAAHFGLPLDAAMAEAIATGPLFASHAKRGGNFAAQVAQEHEAARSAITDQEIAMVDTWIGHIAQSAGVAL